MEHLRRWFTNRISLNGQTSMKNCIQTSLLMRFFDADDELQLIASELDQFDGRKEPERCNALVNQLRIAQDKVISIIFELMDFWNCKRANRDYRIKFPDDLLTGEGPDSLNSQVYFASEILAAGSNILHRERQSDDLRPMAKQLAACLDQIRIDLRVFDNDYPDEKDSRVIDIVSKLENFDRNFAQFEYEYVRAMLPIKSADEIDKLNELAVLLSEALASAIKRDIVSQDAVDECDPGLLMSLPRLGLVYGLGRLDESPIYHKRKRYMSPLFKGYQDQLFHIRRELRKLRSVEVELLERRLASNDCNLFDAELASITSGTSTGTGCGATSLLSAPAATTTEPPLSTTTETSTNAANLDHHADASRKDSLESSSNHSDTTTAQVPASGDGISSPASSHNHLTNGPNSEANGDCKQETLSTLTGVETTCDRMIDEVTSPSSKMTCSSHNNNSNSANKQQDMTQAGSDGDKLQGPNHQTGNEGGGTMHMASIAHVTDSIPSPSTSRGHSHQQQQSQNHGHHGQVAYAPYYYAHGQAAHQHSSSSHVRHYTSRRASELASMRRSTSEPNLVAQAAGATGGSSSGVYSSRRNSTRTSGPTRHSSRRSANHHNTHNHPESGGATSGSGSKTGRKRHSQNSLTPSSRGGRSNRGAVVQQPDSASVTQQETAGNTRSIGPAPDSISALSGATSVTLATSMDSYEVSLAVQAKRCPYMINDSTKEILQWLYRHICEIADQLQSNYASDVRLILKQVFAVHESKPEPEPEATTCGGGGTSSGTSSDQVSVEEALEAHESQTESLDGGDEDTTDTDDSQRQSLAATTTTGASALIEASSSTSSGGIVVQETFVPVYTNTSRSSFYYPAATMPPSHPPPLPPRNHHHHQQSARQSRSSRNGRSSRSGRYVVGDSQQPSGASSAGNSPIHRPQPLVTAHPSSSLEYQDLLMNSSELERQVSADAVRRHHNALLSSPDNSPAQGTLFTRQDLEAAGIAQGGGSGDGITVVTLDELIQYRPRWVDDREVKSCTLCDTLFTLIRRRHHCRSCGHIYCAKCAGQFMRLEHLGYLEPVRVCQPCYENPPQINVHFQLHLTAS